MSKKFSIIVCDFPWSFSDKLEMSKVKRGANSNYSTMTLDKLKLLPIKDLIHDDGSILCMWCPSSLIKEGLDLMELYNFKFKQTYIWVKSKKDPIKHLRIKKKKKTNIDEISNSINSFNLNDTMGFGMGRIFRNCHEICLIGTSNNKIYKYLKNKSQRTVSLAPNLKHSAKPENLQDSLDIMFPDKSINKIELFARRYRNNWVCLGNELDGKDIIDSLSEL